MIEHDNCKVQYHIKYIVTYMYIHVDFRNSRMDYKYTCDICEKSYNHKSSLERHKRRHTGKKGQK